MMIKKLIIFFLSVFPLALTAQETKQAWVDSVLKTMSVEKKIGQLFFTNIPPQATPQQWQTIISLAKEGKVGGVIQQRSGLGLHLKWMRRLQQESKVPVLVAATVTDGLGTALDSTMNFFNPLVLGAIESDSLVEAYGTELTEQMKSAGIQLNLAESVSSNFFNDDSKKGVTKSNLFLGTLKKNGILPGSMWNSESDATKELTVSNVAAIQYQFTNETKIEEVGIDNLRKRLSFEGILISEVSELQRFSPKRKKGEAEKIGFTLGFDVMINSLNIDASIKQIKRLIKKDKLLISKLDQSVRRILSAKYDAGLSEITYPSNIHRRLHSPSALLLKQTIANEAVTVVQNKSEMIPIRRLDDKKFASLSIGNSSFNTFTSYLSKYAAFSHSQLTNLKDTINMSAELAKADVITIALFPTTIPVNELINYIKRLAVNKEVIICSFDDPRILKYFEGIPTVIAAYAGDEEIMQTTAQIIFGGLPSKGSLPIKISDAFANGSKVNTSLSNRFSYQLPESAGMSSRTLEKIEAIANEAIAIGSTPGCYVQVVKDGKVIYDRGFGWLTYEKKSPVTDQTIYDLASVTKVTATLQTVMYMYEQGMIDPYKKISAYLPELKESNKSNFTIKDILTHQAGLWPFLPFWAETVKDSLTQKKYYGHEANEDYPFPVAENLFASRSMKDSLWQWIIHAKIRDKVSRTPYDYRYSDMGFFMLQHLAEKMLGMPMEDFLQKNLYQPIGASSMGYLPLRRFSASQVAPTEDDKLFRKELLIGYVHDQGAAMHGGIAGHAGLFSNANDLAKMGQLWLNGGKYGGVEFLKSETLATFTQKQYGPSRRGLGWDRPTVSDWNGPTTLYSSARTFGHTGFTGTCVWVDPEFNLVYIFLANRVHPDMTNNKILNANIRPRIQEVIYQSIFEYCSRNEK